MADSIEKPWERQALVLYKKYHHRDFLKTDPLEYVHRIIGPVQESDWSVSSIKQGRQIERVAVLSALLAYGGVKQIRSSIEKLLGILQKDQEPGAFAPLPLKFFKHRFTTGSNIETLLHCVNDSWETYGSFGGHLSHHYFPNQKSIPVAQALDGLLSDFKSQIPRIRMDHGMKHLLAQPKDGSSCKRWMMFLRWMVRADPIGERFLDLGIWSSARAHKMRAQGAYGKTLGQGIRPQDLLMPLDTHTGRIAQSYGLTRRKSLGWEAVLEVTEAFKKLDPQDPIKFDFALCRLGIVEGWKP